MILGAIIRTCDRRTTPIDGRVARRTNLKVCELIEIYFNSIGRIALRNCLDTLSRLLHLCITSAIKERVCEIESRVQLAVLVCEIHRSREGNGLVRTLEFGDGEVGGKFESALLIVVRQGRDVGGAFEKCTTLELDRHCQCVLGGCMDGLLCLEC